MISYIVLLIPAKKTGHVGHAVIFFILNYSLVSVSHTMQIDTNLYEIRYCFLCFSEMPPEWCDKWTPWCPKWVPWWGTHLVVTHLLLWWEAPWWGWGWWVLQAWGHISPSCPSWPLLTPTTWMPSTSWPTQWPWWIQWCPIWWV